MVMTKDQLLEKVKKQDFSDFFKPFLSETEIKSMISKASFYLKKKRALLTDLRDLNSIDINGLTSTKGIGENSVELIKRSKNVISSLSVEDLQGYIATIQIDLAMFNPSYLEIPISDINQDWIPSLIVNRLSKLNLITIKDILSNKNIFSDLPASHDAYIGLYHFLIEKEDKVHQDYLNRTSGKLLISPLTVDTYAELDILAWFVNIANSYSSEIKNLKYQDCLIKYFGLENRTKRSFRELSNSHNVAHQRINQIIDEHVLILRKVLLGDESIKDYSKHFEYLPRVSDKDIALFKDFKTSTASQCMLSREYINFLLNTTQALATDYAPYYNLLCKVFELKEARKNPSKGNYGTKRFSTETFFIPNEYKSKYDIIILAANVIYDYLNDQVTPVNEEEIIFTVTENTTLTIADEKICIDLLSVIPEFESIETDEEEDGEHSFYQLRFDKLTTWPKRIERVLFEVDSKLSFKDVFELLSEKFKNYKMDLSKLKTQTVKSSISKSPNVIAFGKQGIYAHSSLGFDGKSIKERILEVFQIANHPLTSSELEHLLNNESSEKISQNRIAGFLTYMKWKELIPLVNRKYILKEWIDLYKKEIAPKAPRPIGLKSKAEEAYFILKDEYPDGILLSKFRKHLIQGHEFYYTTAYSCTSNKTSYFSYSKSKDGDEIIYPLPNPELESEKKTKLKTLTDEAIKYLQRIPEKEIELSVAVGELSEQFGNAHNKQIWYKVFAQTDYFDKITDTQGRYNVTLVADTADTIHELNDIFKEQASIAYEWSKLKRTLKDELEDLLMESGQPIEKSNVSVNELLELLNLFLKTKVSEGIFDYIEEEFLASINKYFLARRDSHEERLYHKAILLSVEVILLKLTYFVNKERFNYFVDVAAKRKNGNVGFGKYFGTLQKLDPNKFRDKDPSELPSDPTKFIKHINTVYHVRNNLAHTGFDFTTGKNWLSSTVNRNIKSALVVILYSLFLYRNEIKKESKPI
jgi:hypothetical protein